MRRRIYLEEVDLGVKKGADVLHLVVDHRSGDETGDEGHRPEGRRHIGSRLHGHLT